MSVFSGVSWHCFLENPRPSVELLPKAGQPSEMQVGDF